LLKYDAPVPTGLRERKKTQTRQQLQQAALTLFREHGFDNVTTDDIAAAVDVSKTTFYRYFGSKDDVLLGNVADGVAAIGAALAERPADEPVLTAVRRAVATVVSASDVPRDVLLLRGRIIRTTPSLIARNLEQQSAWEDVIAEFVRSRLPKRRSSDLDARVVAANVIATMRAGKDYWLATNGRGNLAALIDEVLSTLERGVSSLVPAVPARSKWSPATRRLPGHRA
jgi:AcrR family transcriptional regulator